MQRRSGKQISTNQQGTRHSLRFRSVPLAAAALWFASGILLAHVVWQPTIVLLAALVLLLALTVFALGIRSHVAWVPVAALWLALGLAAAEWQPSPPLPLALLSMSDGLSRTVQAQVVRVRPLPPPLAAATDADAAPPWELTETGETGEPLLSVDLATSAVEQVTPDLSRMLPVTGGVRVSVYPARDLPGTLPPLVCGDLIELPLRLRTPERYRNPGQFQYADYLLAQGIAARGSVAADHLRVVGHAPASLACRLASVQTWAAGRLQAFAGSAADRRLPALLRLSDSDARMLNAMLFGDRSGLTHALRTSFERTGSFHLFVVSGLHIALIAGAVFWLLRRLRAPAWLATSLTLALTTVYAAVTGLGAPAERALVMSAAFLVARLLSRGTNSLNALGAAALAMLVWSPSSLFDAGFQMTLLALVAIAGLAVPLSRYTFLHAAQVARTVFRRPGRYMVPPEAQLRMRLELWGELLERLTGRFGRLRPRKLPAYALRLACFAGELALVGLVTELVMVLPMAMWFHRAAVFALPANMVVIPVLALLIPAAVLTFACSLIGPWLAVVPGALTAFLLHLVAWGIGRLSRLQIADVRVPGPVWWVGLLAVAAWLGCCWLVRRGRWGALATACALPLIAAAVLWPERPVVASERPLELTALDVGQGDSLLAVNPDGRAMLIDAGGPIGQHGLSETVSNFDIGEQVVAPYLWSRRFRRLDVLVLTHAHTDHMGGMAAVLEALRPRELWVSVDTGSALYRQLIRQAGRLGVNVRHLHAGDRQAWGPVAISVLAPQPGYVSAGSPRNDDSLVLKMQFGRSSVLLEGDAERPSEDAMLAAGLIGPVTLLKVGHHGSRTSSNPEFLAAARPREAIVSVGRHNSFGHPRGDVIERFAEAHTTLYRTDLMGLTSFFLTADGRISSQAENAPVFAH